VFPGVDLNAKRTVRIQNWVPPNRPGRAALNPSLDHSLATHQTAARIGGSRYNNRPAQEADEPDVS
jgi:hypothetical protein